MSTTELSFSLRQQGQVHVVAFDRPSLDPEAIEQFRERLKARIAQTPGMRLVIDLQSINYTPSRFLGVLVEIQQALTRAGGDLRVCGLEPMILDVFKVMQLHRILQLSASCDEAVKSLEV